MAGRFRFATLQLKRTSGPLTVALFSGSPNLTDPIRPVGSIEGDAGSAASPDGEAAGGWIDVGVATDVDVGGRVEVDIGVSVGSGVGISTSVDVGSGFATLAIGIVTDVAVKI